MHLKNKIKSNATIKKSLTMKNWFNIGLYITKHWNHQYLTYTHAKNKHIN